MCMCKMGCFLPFTNVNLEVFLQIVWHSLQRIGNTPNIDGLTAHFADIQQKKNYIHSELCC